MKSKLPYFLLIVLGFVSFFVYRYWYLQSHPSTFKSQSAVLSSVLPTSALAGKIISQSGTVTKLSRQSSDFQPVTNNDSFLQGETIQTDNKSSSEVLFDNLLNFKLGSISTITLIDTNQKTFLINQTGGLVDYQLLSDNPISVRILHLLIQLDSGESQISIDSQKIIIHLTSGSLTLAFNDKTNTTNLVNFTAPKTITFDDTYHTYTSKNR